MIVKAVTGAKARCGSDRWKLGMMVSLVVLFGAVSVPASAVPVTVTFAETTVCCTTYLYNYTVTNTGELGPGFNIFDVFFTNLSPGVVVNIVLPGGWDSNPDGDTFVDSFSTDIPFDIVAGSFRSGFGFTVQ